MPLLKLQRLYYYYLETGPPKIPQVGAGRRKKEIIGPGGRATEGEKIKYGERSRPSGAGGNAGCSLSGPSPGSSRRQACSCDPVAPGASFIELLSTYLEEFI